MINGDCSRERFLLLIAGSDLFNTVSPMSLRTLTFVSLLVIVCSGCAGSPPLDEKIPKGRCVYNSDCPPGNQCVNTYCEDIYHPEAKIKQR